MFKWLIALLWILPVTLPSFGVVAVDRESILVRLENEIRTSVVEVAICADPVTGGKRVQFTGSASSVRISTTKPCYGSVILHNHPSGDPHLSLPDLQVAELYNASELRVVGKEYTCVLVKPPHRIYYGIGLTRPLTHTPGYLTLWQRVEVMLTKLGPALTWSRLLPAWGLEYLCYNRTQED